MFVEHKEAGEVTEAPTKTLKLSEAIRLGCQVLPYGYSTLNNHSGCSIGAAWIALGRTVKERWGYETPEMISFVAERTNTPIHLATEIWDMHARGDTREKTADWLESQGY